MNGPERSAKRFVVDTNVFVAAVKPFSKPDQKSPNATRTLGLLIKLITDERLELVGNSRLVDEYRRLAEGLNSETSRLVLQQLTAKMKILEPDERTLLRCKRYLPPKESADVIHAATTLDAGAVLITDDRDFGRIRQSGIIEVWGISEAIRTLLRDT